jgi:2-C-methyl-D-erythritol 4-phosphate cytidylyltransferase
MARQNPPDTPHKVTAVIPAAGSGMRMGSREAKQFLDLAGMPLLALTLRPFQECRLVDGIVLVVRREDISYCVHEIVDGFHLSKVKEVVAGGRRRQDSVRQGIESVPDDCGWVLVHDGVRPFISAELIQRVIRGTQQFRAVIPGVPLKETIKQADRENTVIRSIDRVHLWLIQTPQIFRLDDIRLAHQEAVKQGWREATDDALLLEKLGIPIKIIKGEEGNIKVTTPHDLELARFLISTRSHHL